MPLARLRITLRFSLLCAGALSAALAALPQKASALELPPLNLIPPAVTGTPVVGQPLGCSQGVWVGPPSAYAYQWTRDGSDVPGATAASYAVVADDVGKALRCRVRGSNSMGSASATSLPVVGLAVGSPASPGPTPPPSTPGTGPAPPKPGELIRLPKTNSCASPRRIRIRLRKVRGVKIAAVAVYVNGRAVKVYRGKRSTARLELRGLPRGTVRVRIVAVTTDGRLIRQTRKYRTCAKKRAAKRKHRR
jgi:hypothetical protein